jgi:hypothetical protein
LKSAFEAAGQGMTGGIVFNGKAPSGNEAFLGSP